MRTRVLLLAVALLISAAGSLGQERTDTSEARKFADYEKQKKSPTIAFLLSLAIPSTGHAYAGRWPTGLLFAAGRVGGFVLTAAAGASFTFSTGFIVTAWFSIGIAATLIFTVWEAIDASSSVEKFNKDLYEKIMGRDESSVRILPSIHGLQIQFTHSL